MTVIELKKRMEQLETLGLGNVQVEIADSYARNEGYSGDDEYATSSIDQIIFRDWRMCIE